MDTADDEQEEQNMIAAENAQAIIGWAQTAGHLRPDGKVNQGDDAPIIELIASALSLAGQLGMDTGKIMAIARSVADC